MSVLALIPARGGSKRLPRKNVLPIDGRPILSYPIEMARKSGLFDQVFVSTEDNEIAKAAILAGANVIERPVELAQDRSTVVEVCLHALNILQGVNLICCIYATAFLLRPESLINSMKLLDEPPSADFVMGVSEYSFPAVQALQSDDFGFLSYMWPEWQEFQSQFYPKLVVSNGSFYWARTESLQAARSFYGKRLKGYLMDSSEVTDINTEADLLEAIRIYRTRK